MNLPNKITIGRIFLSIIMIILLLIPWYDLNVQFPEYVINGEIINLKYIIFGFNAISSFNPRFNSKF